MNIRNLFAAGLACLALTFTGCKPTLDTSGVYGSGHVFNTNSASLQTNTVVTISTNLLTGVATTNLTQTITTVTNAAVVADGMVLYIADQILGESYDAMNEFVTTEINNRATLAAISPNFRTAADVIRANGKTWWEAGKAARTTYFNNPSAQTHSMLTSSLEVLFTAVGQAEAIAVANKNVVALPPALQVALPQPR